MATSIKRKDSNYFVQCSFFWYLLIIGAFSVNFVAWYNPSAIPAKFFGPIGAGIQHLGKNYNDIVGLVFFGGILAHVAEAYYASVLCRRQRIKDSVRYKWIMQTFWLGFPSLRLLLR